MNYIELIHQGEIDITSDYYDSISEHLPLMLMNIIKYQFRQSTRSWSGCRLGSWSLVKSIAYRSIPMSKSGHHIANLGAEQSVSGYGYEAVSEAGS